MKSTVAIFVGLAMGVLSTGFPDRALSTLSLDDIVSVKTIVILLIRTSKLVEKIPKYLLSFVPLKSQLLACLVSL